MRNLRFTLKNLNNLALVPRVTTAWLAQARLAQARLVLAGLVLVWLVLAWPMRAHAEEIFHWVDANGVHHYSQSPPPRASSEVRTLEVNGNQPASYNPAEDRYNVAAQEAAMQQLREKLAESRKNEAQDQQMSSGSTIVHYPNPDNMGNSIFYPPDYRPGLPNWPPGSRPPHRPDRPGGKPDRPGTLPDDAPPASFPFRPLRPRP